MFRTCLKLAFMVAGTLYFLTLILGIRMNHELNEALPEGQKRGLFSGWGTEASKLHHQFFPNSHLGIALRASQIAAVALGFTSWVIYALTL
jgi:hypothetical protein